MIVPADAKLAVEPTTIVAVEPEVGMVLVKVVYPS
jgi:hypothetical protein